MLYKLPLPQIEALALPILLGANNAEAHAEYVSIRLHKASENFKRSGRDFSATSCARLSIPLQ